MGKVFEEAVQKFGTQDCVFGKPTYILHLFSNHESRHQKIFLDCSVSNATEGQ